jgi:hypothetical protein
LTLAARPDLFGLLKPCAGVGGYLHSLGIVWLTLGIGGLVFRIVQLLFLRSPL